MAHDYKYTETHGPAEIGDIQAAIAAGAALGEPRNPVAEPGAGIFTVVPKNYEVKSLEEFLPHPLRIEEKVSLQDADSFIAYVNSFKTAPSRIFFNVEDEEFRAILDYHETERPSWCGHVAMFKPRRSEEFKAWMDSNRKQMTQIEFARFLEERLGDIVEPNSAEMLQVALSFEAKKTVDFASGARLNNGQVQFQYDEIVRGTTQKGTIEVPEAFVLGIPIHVNGPAYRIDVRLRWRLQESKLVFWYEIVRPHRFIEDALKEIRQRVEQETGVGVFAGALE
jgi:uncharacterized protein YfdQ (DUF2303 family)